MTGELSSMAVRHGEVQLHALFPVTDSSHLFQPTCCTSRCCVIQTLETRMPAPKRTGLCRRLMVLCGCIVGVRALTINGGASGSKGTMLMIERASSCVVQHCSASDEAIQSSSSLALHLHIRSFLLKTFQPKSASRVRKQDCSATSSLCSRLR